MIENQIQRTVLIINRSVYVTYIFSRFTTINRGKFIPNKYSISYMTIRIGTSIVFTRNATFLIYVTFNVLKRNIVYRSVEVTRLLFRVFTNIFR